MRTLILFVLLCGSVCGQDFSQRFGNTTYRNDGSTRTRYGRMTEYYRADGSFRGYSQRFGNTRMYQRNPTFNYYTPQQLPSMRSYSQFGSGAQSDLGGYEFPEIKGNGGMPRYPR